MEGKHTMTTRSLVDPELRAALGELPADILTIDTLPEVRRRRAALAAERPPPDPALGSIAVHPVAEASVRVFTPVRADDTRLPALLHLHGGGYVGGAAADRDAERLALAAELGCVIASVEYRLAPESPYPGPVEDAYAALCWLHEQADALGIDRTRIAVGGESAGGGLAAALALLARDRGKVRPVFQHLVYPMLDDRTVVAGDPNPVAGEFVWTAQQNRFGWTALLGREPGGPDVPAYAAPARAQDLSGLPPAFIMVGALDLFLDEDLDYARRLIRAGVPCELHVFPGAYHGFDEVPNARVAMVARNRSRAALRSALHPRRQA